MLRSNWWLVFSAMFMGLAGISVVSTVFFVLVLDPWPVLLSMAMFSVSFVGSLFCWAGYTWERP